MVTMLSALAVSAMALWFAGAAAGVLVGMASMALLLRYPGVRQRLWRWYDEVARSPDQEG